jgi:hypothetical protein
MTGWNCWSDEVDAVVSDDKDKERSERAII